MSSEIYLLGQLSYDVDIPENGKYSRVRNTLLQNMFLSSLQTFIVPTSLCVSVGLCELTYKIVYREILVKLKPNLYTCRVYRTNTGQSFTLNSRLKCLIEQKSHSASYEIFDL